MEARPSGPCSLTRGFALVRTQAILKLDNKGSSCRKIALSLAK